MGAAVNESQKSAEIRRLPCARPLDSYTRGVSPNLVQHDVRVGRTDLVAAGERIDPSFTESILRRAIQSGTVPTSERGRPGWGQAGSWSQATIEQVEALATIRLKDRSPDTHRALLWIKGFPVEPGVARRAMKSQLERAHEGIENEIAKRLIDDDGAERTRQEAIAAIARDAARHRKHPLPHFDPRQRLAERTDAVALMLSLFLDEAIDPDELTARSRNAERTLGVHRGRRGLPLGLKPWMTDSSATALAGFARVGSLPRLLEVVERASDEDLELARLLHGRLVAGLRLFVVRSDAYFGKSNALGMSAVLGPTHSSDGETMTVLLIASMLSDERLRVGIAPLVAALDRIASIDRALHEVARAPLTTQEQIRRRLARVPFADRLRIERLLDSVRVGLPVAQFHRRRSA